MNTTTRRALLYGGAALTLGAIALANHAVSRDADVMTLLSSVDVQLRLAHGMPAVNRDGAPLTAREQMITAAEASLATVERVAPGMAVAAEFRGFAHMLRGEYAAAAGAYARARGCDDCGQEQRDVLAFNEARMLTAAGRHEAALAVFAEHAEALDARYGHQRVLEEAAILRQLGRDGEARHRLARVLADEAAGPMAWLQAGVQHLELGDDALAAGALGRVAADVPIADYYLALLKLRQGDADTSLVLLGRAAEAAPAEVRKRLHDEAASWSAVAGEARFQELTRTAATPVR